MLFKFFEKQAWECSPGKEVLWNILSLFTSSGMLFLEISLVAFLLKGNYSGGMEAMFHNLIISGTLVGVDVLLKVIYECTSRFVSVSWLFFLLFDSTIYATL